MDVRRPVRALSLALVVAISCAAASAQAQTVAPAFAGAYTLTSLGSVPGLPTPYGGLAFIDSDTILIGGAANVVSGRLYTIDVTRDVAGHITGFVGSVAAYGAVGEYNDGGVAFGPGGVLFTARWPVNELGQTKPGSTDEDAVTSLTPLGVVGSPGGLAFVPPGVPGVGRFKMVSWSGGQWYDVVLGLNSGGTFDLLSATLETTLGGGPEGIAYVPPGSPLFASPTVLISEYSAGRIAVYEVTAAGDPILSTRQDFVTGLTGAEGAVIDPVTGDFLFSTFGGANQVVRVSGFETPPPTAIQITGRVTDTGTLPLAGVTMTLTGSSSATTTTAADGTYGFTNLSSGGSLTVTPTLSGRAFTPPARTFTGTTTDQTADFVGRIVFRISGQVRDLNDTGVAGVTMTLSGTETDVQTTDLDGRYAFLATIGGTYTVTPTKGSFEFTPPGQTFTNLSKDEVAAFFVAQVGTFVRYFAEGATGSFFDTQIALLNATGRASTATVRFQQPPPAPEVTTTVNLAGIQRVTIDPKALGLTTAEFSTVVESTQPIIADRTMTWDARGYGSHAETSIGRPLTQWFLAEGATIASFDLFYLLQNPNDVAAQVQVKYLLPAPAAPVTRSYEVAPRSRFNIWVNTEGPELANAEMSAVITSTNAVPVIAERAMYRPVGAQVFGAGHESAGVEAPALRWFFAEGATGPFFDLFFLIANPNDTASAVTATYLKPDGSVVTRSYDVAPNSRFNVWVDYEGAELADTAVGTTFEVTNGVPVIIERAMWWGGSVASWYEGHNSAGATATGEKWGLAEGEVGGPRSLETYILIANTTTQPGTARVTLTFENGAQAVKEYALPPSSRTNVAVGLEFPEAAGQRFGAIVESLGTEPVQLVVERAMYNDEGGVFWAAGTNALGTKLR